MSKVRFFGAFKCLHALVVLIALGASVGLWNDDRFMATTIGFMAIAMAYSAHMWRCIGHYGGRGTILSVQDLEPSGLYRTISGPIREPKNGHDRGTIYFVDLIQEVSSGETPNHVVVREEIAVWLSESDVVHFPHGEEPRSFSRVANDHHRFCFRVQRDENGGLNRIWAVDHVHQPVRREYAGSSN